VSLAIVVALEALEVGDVSHAEAVLLSALEDGRAERAPASALSAGLPSSGPDSETNTSGVFTATPRTWWHERRTEIGRAVLRLLA
jgi:hypothetical protein